MSNVMVVLFEHTDTAISESCVGGRKEILLPPIRWKKRDTFGTSLQPMAECPDCDRLQPGIEKSISHK